MSTVQQEEPPHLTKLREAVAARRKRLDPSTMSIELPVIRERARNMFKRKPVSEGPL